jgi:hypothetical protein
MASKSKMKRNCSFEMVKLEMLDLMPYGKEYMDSLFNDMSELRYLQRSLLQRIQTFDCMKR